MTPTPRTDAILADDKGDSSLIHNLAIHARQLERERNELLEALEACMKIIGPPHALESECWATTDEINASWDKGTAAIAKTKRKL